MGSGTAEVQHRKGQQGTSWCRVNKDSATAEVQHGVRDSKGSATAKVQHGVGYNKGSATAEVQHSKRQQRYIYCRRKEEHSAIFLAPHRFSLFYWDA